MSLSPTNRQVFKKGKNIFIDKLFNLWWELSLACCNIRKYMTIFEEERSSFKIALFLLAAVKVKLIGLKNEAHSQPSTGLKRLGIAKKFYRNIFDLFHVCSILIIMSVN